jgi:hypothetical protein
MKGGEFLDQLTKYKLFKEDLCNGIRNSARAPACFSSFVVLSVHMQRIRSDWLFV